MPPRSRTQTPARRPRVAGLRDPRRHQDADPTTTSPATDDTPDAATVDADAVSTTTAGRASRTTTSSPRHDSDPAGTGGTAEASGTAAAAPRTTPVSLDKTAPAGGGTDTAVEAAAPTRTARPTPTGRARTTRRRPAPATGSARTEARPRRGRRGTAAPARRGTPSWLVPVLAVAVVVLLVLAGVSFFLGHRAWSGPSRSNTAVIDPAATAEVVGATRQAMEQVFSYDPTKLDDSLNAARSLGTGDFPRQYAEVFERSTKPNAQQQGLRQTASVLDIGVHSIDGDDANLVVLVQFDVTRAATGQSATTPGLLSADMHRDGGRWKVSRVAPLTGQG